MQMSSSEEEPFTTGDVHQPAPKFRPPALSDSTSAGVITLTGTRCALLPRFIGSAPAQVFESLQNIEIVRASIHRCQPPLPDSFSNVTDGL